MKTITLGRLLLSKSFILSCQIASLLAVVFLLSDIVDASDLLTAATNKVQSQYELLDVRSGSD